MRKLFRRLLNRRANKYWLFTPSNRLKIRNIGRGWSDRDFRLFHACFTILCDFIEKEHGGIEKWNEYVNWCRIEYFKNPSEFPIRQYEYSKVYDRLYRWYTSIDWNSKDIDFIWGDFNKIFDEKLMLLIKHYGGLWT